MGLLDGTLTSVFGAAFGAIYMDATLHRRSMVDDGTGTVTPVETDQAVKAQLDSATQAMRGQDGYSDTDMRVIILAAGVTRPNDDAEVTIRGQRWKLSNITLDPAATHYDCRGRRA